MIVNNIINKIKKASKIALTFHVSPDGDSIGSSLAFMLGLRSIGKKVYILSKESLPDIFKYLPSSSEVDGNTYTIIEDTELLITLDCGSIERLNFDNSSIESRKYTLINLDHHLSNDMFADLNYVNTNASSMGEIVYQILQLMNIRITEDIAACLYTSLVTDTGSFRHSNTTSVTHTIAGDLINTGLDFSQIHRNIFDNKKIEELKLQAKVIDGMYMTHNNKVCVMKLTKQILSELNADEELASDIINIGTKIGSVEVALLIKETENGVKVSLRSKSIADVRKVCEKFGGGGHIRAAGAKINMTIDEAERALLKEIEEELMK
ncbi:MAG: bifunctional oligoribonuclease/PAP phosphatase NrnA [Bacillota bacterium]|nr:bifunctional oligoribonuclease/PAP phosphatase NrnA [Bacillota bacterium]